MTTSFKPEVIEATIAGTVFRKCVFVGERYLAACQSDADDLADRQPMVTALPETGEEASSESGGRALESGGEEPANRASESSSGSRTLEIIGAVRSDQIAMQIKSLKQALWLLAAAIVLAALIIFQSR